MTELEWRTCECPYEMLRHLDGKLDDEAFMRFSVACCRRIWVLITDPRSRAVIEVTEAYLAGSLTAYSDSQPVFGEWNRARETGELVDLAGGISHDAVDSVCGVGLGHAAQVAMACFESAGYAASESLRAAGAPQTAITAAWLTAENAEQLAQCSILREIFGHR